MYDVLRECWPLALHAKDDVRHAPKQCISIRIRDLKLCMLRLTRPSALTVLKYLSDYSSDDWFNLFERIKQPPRCLLSVCMLPAAASKQSQHNKKENVLMTYLFEDDSVYIIKWYDSVLTLRFRLSAHTEHMFTCLNS